MVRRVHGESVRGASHIRIDMPCQDSYKKVELSDTVSILAVADGHGSSACPYSKTGSVIATNVFCAVMQDLVQNFADQTEFLVTYLNREGEVKVAQAIDEEWKRRVRKVHTNSKRERLSDWAAVYKQYGTTLLGLLVTEEFVFAFQLGDGDILFIDENEIQPIIQADKILGTETHSLCRENAWKKAITVIRRRKQDDGIPYLYLMSTDGFANSFSSTEEFEKNCRGYFDMINEHGFKAVTDNLKDWLQETSELGCGDDITVVMAYFEK